MPLRPIYKFKNGKIFLLRQLFSLTVYHNGVKLRKDYYRDSLGELTDYCLYQNGLDTVSIQMLRYFSSKN